MRPSASGQAAPQPYSHRFAANDLIKHFQSENRIHRRMRNQLLSASDRHCHKANEAREGRVMQRIESGRRLSHDQFSRDAELKQELEVLKKENSRLKGLVVRLSETIIRKAAGKK